MPFMADSWSSGTALYVDSKTSVDFFYVIHSFSWILSLNIVWNFWYLCRKSWVLLSSGWTLFDFLLKFDLTRTCPDGFASPSSPPAATLHTNFVWLCLHGLLIFLTLGFDTPQILWCLVDRLYSPDSTGNVNMVDKLVLWWDLGLLELGHLVPHGRRLGHLFAISHAIQQPYNKLTTAIQQPYNSHTIEFVVYNKLTTAIQQPYNSHTTAIQQTYNSHTTAIQQPYNKLTIAIQQPYNSHTTAIQQPYNSHTTAYNTTTVIQQPYNSHTTFIPQ